MSFFREKATKMLIAYWVHDLSPFLWELAPGVGVRWYGLAYVAGFVLAYLLFKRWVRQGWLPLDGRQVGDFLTWVVMGTVVGGRLGYCFFYAGGKWMVDPLYVLRVWEGGMASHGGIMGLLLVVWIFSRKHKVDGWRLGDAVAVAAPWGVVLGRMANFINGELWGRPSSVPWAVIFPASVDMLPRHPYQIYAALFEGAAVGVLAIFLKRFFMMEGSSGVVMGGVILVYSVMRICTEFFREPDGGRYWWLGLTEGQWLSVVFAMVGVVVIFSRTKNANVRDAKQS